MSISNLLKKSTPGSHISKMKHIKRGEKIALMIQERFSINSPYQWQVKHLKWVLQILKQSITVSTLYDYWLTVRVIASSLGKWSNWKNYLPNPKHTSVPKYGGRKALLSNKSSQISNRDSQ